MRPRRGIAMITVLGVVTLASTLAFVAAEGGHLALDSTRNRVAEARSFWLAQGCAARVLSALDTRWNEEEGLARDRFWRLLDEEGAIGTALAGLPCKASLESRGARLDIWRTEPENLSRLVAAVHPDGPAIQVATTVIAWRDSLEHLDADAKRGPLRRRALAAHLQATLGTPPTIGDRLASHLSAGTGPVDHGRAPRPVLAALPGFTTRTADALILLREHEPQLKDLYAMLGRLSREDADELSRSFLELSHEVVFLPSTWTLEVVATDPEAPVVVTWSLGRAPRHLVATSEVK